MSKSAIPKGGNDCIMTPDSLALAIVRHFRPTLNVLEPCEGEGAFVRAVQVYSIEQFTETSKCPIAYHHHSDIAIKEGRDFLTINWMPLLKYHWIITNPPWSQFLAFLKRSMQFADNIVFLGYANAWFVKSRINAMEAAGFHFREFAYVANPKKPWPQMGLQMAAVHISREPGNCKFSKIDWTP